MWDVTLLGLPLDSADVTTAVFKLFMFGWIIEHDLFFGDIVLISFYLSVFLRNLRKYDVKRALPDLEHFKRLRKIRTFNIIYENEHLINW